MVFIHYFMTLHRWKYVYNLLYYRLQGELFVELIAIYDRFTVGFFVGLFAANKKRI